MKEAIDSIQEELQQQLKILEDDNKLLEAQRLNNAQIMI